MHNATTAALGAGLLATALLLTACSPTNPPGAGASSPPSSTASASAAAPPASSSPSPATATSPADSSTSGSGSSGAPAAAAPDCTAVNLQILNGPSGGGAPTPLTSIKSFNLLNTGATSSICSMYGFPGVDLIGTDEATGQQMRVSLGRIPGAAEHEVTLSAGTEASFDIRYQPSTTPAHEFIAQAMLLTPPNTYRSISYPLGRGWNIYLIGPTQVNAALTPVTSGPDN